MFLLCAVKVPDVVTEMMMAEFHHQEACQRINSVLKFYTLWRFRYQVWPRMEEGAQQIFKVRSTPYLHGDPDRCSISTGKDVMFECVDSLRG